MSTTRRRLSAHDVRRVAVLAMRDPRSVTRYLADPSSVRSCVGASIEAALADLGLCPSVEPHKAA